MSWFCRALNRLGQIGQGMTYPAQLVDAPNVLTPCGYLLGVTLSVRPCRYAENVISFNSKLLSMRKLATFSCQCSLDINSMHWAKYSKAVLLGFPSAALCSMAWAALSWRSSTSRVQAKTVECERVTVFVEVGDQRLFFYSGLSHLNRFVLTGPLQLSLAVCDMSCKRD